MSKAQLLADRVQAFLSDPLKELRLNLLRIKPVIPGMMQMKLRLRQAKRYVLTDDFVRKAVEASTDINSLKQAVERSERHANLAWLPFENVWIEYDLNVRLSHGKNIGTTKFVGMDLEDRTVKRPAGALLHRIMPSIPGAWISQGFSITPPSNEHPGTVMPHLVSQVLHPVWVQDVTNYKMPVLMMEGDDELEVMNLQALLSGWGYDLEHPGMNSKVGGRLLDLGGTIPDELIGQKLLQKGPSEQAKMDMAQYVFEDARDTSGDLRFLVAVMAMINHVPVEYRQVPLASERYMSHGRSHQHLDHEVVTIRTGKKIVNVRKVLDRAAKEYGHSGIKHREHDVRGFWMVAQRGKAVLGCAHVPVERDGDYALCSSCENLIVWVPEHKRGDPALGRVEHTFRVR